MQKTVLFLDSGDTLIDEASQVYDLSGVILRARLLPGVEDTLRRLKADGHLIAMVADGPVSTFENIYRENGLYKLFDAHIYSEAVGAQKPDRRMFLAAMGALGLEREDAGRIVMVGNNLSRDIKGANACGIQSVFFRWSPRYQQTPGDSSELPNHVITSFPELLEIVHTMDEQLKKAENVVF